MLIVSNLAEHDAQVNVALAEGVRPAGAMTDCISAENVPVTAGALSLTVQAKSFRMLTG